MKPETVEQPVSGRAVALCGNCHQLTGLSGLLFIKAIARIEVKNKLQEKVTYLSVRDCPRCSQPLVAEKVKLVA
ncbi:MAG: hypothetical protein L0Y56_20660 [Nitrospira sp.]|nr:hypothetical protein [Nitrospira sp.]